jgi:predicted nucleic acid-binding protein
MSATETVFVDTNVLVYARDSSEPEKQPAALEWIDRLWATRLGRISIQVLNEYYVTVTRKLSPGLPVEEAREDVRALSTWDPVPLDVACVEEAFSVQEDHAIPYWDALIVAAARRAGAAYLLTEDLQDGQGLDGVVVLDPFSHTPAEILG